MEAGMNIQFWVQCDSAQETEWEMHASRVDVWRSQLLLKGLDKEN
jgi:hypothetical protein